MNTPAGLEHCFTFINCQLSHSDRRLAEHTTPVGKCAITISRQCACGAHFLAEKLAAFLQSHAPSDSPHWTVFDRNLMETVLADHHLPERLARYMPEDRVRQIDDIMDDLFGLLPSSWTLVQQTAETILRLAELGNVIILGRGANVITARLPHTLHVRLIGSLERRIQHMQHFERLSVREASERIRHEDLGRQRYLKQHFGKDIEDPLLYHLVINTDLVSLEEAVQTIGHLALNHKVPLA